MRRVTAWAAGVPALAAVGTAGLVGIAGPAGAGGQFEPMIGDLNGDGWDDRAILVDEGATCGVGVQLGDAFGAFGPITTYSFPAPGTDVPYCPDMGSIVDLGGDGVSELVLAWWAGRPSGVDHDLLVLEGYTPAGGFDALYQPNNMGTADFDGDGLVDVWQYTDQGAGFATFLNTPAGELVPGPMRHAHLSLEADYQFGDFDEDGATDVAFSFIEGAAPAPSSGVAVLLDDGTVTYLEPDDMPDRGWDVEVADTDYDGHLDVRTLNEDTGVVRVHVGNGDGTFTSPK